MKQKRLLTWILAVVLVVSAACFVACGDDEAVKTLDNLKLPTLANNEMVVVEKISDSEYKYFTVALTGSLSEGSTLLDVLEYLQENYDITLELSDGFINKFDQLPHDGVANEYVYLYTSVENDFNTSAYVETFDCDGTIVKTSAVGCSEMSVEYGCVIYISTIVYNG